MARNVWPMLVWILYALALANVTSASAESTWRPERANAAIGVQTRVVGDIEVVQTAAGAVRVRGWIVDAYSATRPNRVEVRDLAGRRLGEVAVGGFERRTDVADRFGSSAYALSGFDVSLSDVPSVLVVRAHLGQLGWWQTTVESNLTRTARVVRLECVSSDIAELEVISAEPFPVRDALTVLELGRVVAALSRYPDNGDTHGLIFSLSRDDLFNRVSPDDLGVVRYDPSNGHDVWQLGAVDVTTVQACGGLPQNVSPAEA